MAKIFIETHTNGTLNHRELHSRRDVTFNYLKLHILVGTDTVEGVVLRADFTIRRYCRWCVIARTVLKASVLCSLYLSHAEI